MKFPDLSKIPKWKLVGIVLVVTLVGMSAVAKYVQIVTTDEIYCLTCHAKQRYVDMWEKSEVHTDIKCADCHGMPAELLKFDLSAHQEDTNRNCIRCHRDLTETGKKVVFKFNEFRILIPHKAHLDSDILCTDCHSNIRHERKADGTYRPTMMTCFHCHPREETFCTQCHPHGSLELPHQKHVTKVECSKCHHDYEDKEFTIHDTTLSHRPHEEGDVECEACHSNAKKHGEIIREREGCQECHEL